MGIEIRIFGETAEEALYGFKLMAAEFGLVKAGGLSGPVQSDPVQPAPEPPTTADVTVDTPAEPVSAPAEQTGETESAFRERGKPSAGKSRRNKEETAEDKRLDELVEQTGADDAAVSKAVVERGHAAVIAELEQHVAENSAKSNISSDPENRQDPDNPDDDAAAEQDKADEKAEAEANRDDVAGVTVDDLRNAMSEYVSKFGMPATQEDGPAIFAEALGSPPSDEAGWRLSLVREMGAEALDKAIAAWKKAAAADSRFGTA